MNKNDVIKRYIAHFGAIMCNYSVTGFVLIALFFFSFLFSGLLAALATIGIILYNILLFVVGVFSIGLLFLSDEYRNLYSMDMLNNLSDYGEKMNNFFETGMEWLPYVSIVIGILSIIAFCCLMFDRKWDKARSKLIILATIAIILIVMAILFFAGIIVIAKGA